MTRILDIDLDFFVGDVAHFRASDGKRLDPEAYPPWSHEDAVGFISDQCKVDKKLPGFVVEHHAELFPLWRVAIGSGQIHVPLSVTHVDAHADLGLGDPGFIYLMSELLFHPVSDRQFPALGFAGLNDSNWLIFVTACQWLSDLTYVYNRNDEHPGDILALAMENFCDRAEYVQLAGVDPEDTWRLGTSDPPEVRHLEPKVPFSAVPWPKFQAPETYDVVCLTRSPGFTPKESDDLFEEIRGRFIDETHFR